MGDVAEQEVRLHQFGWGGKARYPMVFSGRFQNTEIDVILAGRFSLRIGSRIWLSFLLGLSGIFLVGVGMQAMSRRDTPWWAPLAIFGVIVVSVVGIRWGQRTSSNQWWLAQTMADALRNPDDRTRRSGE